MTDDLIELYGDGIGTVELIKCPYDDRDILAPTRVSTRRDRVETTEAADFRLIKRLLRDRHLSPFEHNLTTMRCVIPLYVIQEMLRHRTLIFNQESARYVEIIPQAYIPTSFRKQSKTNKQSSYESDEIDQLHAHLIYQESVETAYRTYRELLDQGIAREHARGVLPHCTYTTLYVSFSLRSLFHFLSLRLDGAAQYEIQCVARAFDTLTAPFFPMTFRARDELAQEQHSGTVSGA